jgi:hypothetical protein
VRKAGAGSGPARPERARRDPGARPDHRLLPRPAPAPGPAGGTEAGTVLIVGPAAVLHPRVPQPAGSLVYELLTGHPEREPGELIFLADLAVELRAWPKDTWTKLGVDPEQVAQAVIGRWRDGEVAGLQVDDLSFEEARSLTRPAMTYVRSQLRGRLTVRLGRAYQRWLHPTSGRAPATGSCSGHVPTQAMAGCGRLSAGVRNPDSHHGRRRRNRPGVRRRFRRRPTPAARWPRRADTDRTPHPPSRNGHRRCVRPPVNPPGRRTPRRTRPPQRSHCRWPLCGAGSDTDRRCGTGGGHLLSVARPADRSVSSGTPISGHDRRGCGSRGAAVPPRRR